MGKGIGFVFIAGFVLIWSGATLTIDYLLLSNVVNQAAAKNYPTVTGRIEISRIDEDTDSEGGTTYRPFVRYRYEADGKEYVSEQLRYGLMGASDRSYAKGIVMDYPAEKAVTVYYNPSDAADAVLRTELDAMDYFRGLFLLPFNAVMLGLWYGIGWSLIAWISPPRYGGAKVRREGFETRIQVNQTSPVLMFIVGVGGTAFVLIFIVAFTFGFNSPIAAQVGFGLALAGGFGLSFWQWGKNLSPHSDLVIDRSATSLILPPCETRKEPMPLSLTEISRVEMKELSKLDSDGDKVTSYAPTVYYLRDGELHSEPIMKWSDEKCTQRFTDWLQRELGLSLAQDR